MGASITEESLDMPRNTLEIMVLFSSAAWAVNLEDDLQYFWKVFAWGGKELCLEIMFQNIQR